MRSFGVVVVLPSGNDVPGLRERAEPMGVEALVAHNARGAILDVYTAWEWPALCEAVSRLKVDPDRLPGRICNIFITNAFLKTLIHGNHYACSVEAVGMKNIRFRADSGNYR